MPERFTLPSGDLASITTFAVAICTNGCSHVGIAFRNKNGDLRFWHLARHNDLRLQNACDELPGNYGWAVPLFEDMELLQVAGFVSSVAAKKKIGDIAFSLRYCPDECRYSEDGSLILEGLHGFTCATFVLSLIDRIRPLLDYFTWIPRSDDESSQLELLEFVKRRATQEHVDREMASIPCLRFRPLDVAGASTANPCPADGVDMPTADRIGREIDDALRDFYAA